MQGIWEDFFRFFDESVFERNWVLKKLLLYRKKFYFFVELFNVKRYDDYIFDLFTFYLLIFKAAFISPIVDAVLVSWNDFNSLFPLSSIVSTGLL